MAFVLMVTSKGGMHARLGRRIRRRRRDGLDSRLLIVGDDCQRLSPLLLRFGRGFFQYFNFAIDAQHLRHLLLELSVAVFKIVTHLVRLDFLLAEDLAHGTLDQMRQTLVPGRGSTFARVACQEARRSQFMRIAVVLGFVARQRHQPAFGLRRDRRFFARPRFIKTMGVVDVAALAAIADALPPAVAVKFTRLAPSPLASSGSRSKCASAQRYSIATFFPSTNPPSERPLWNAFRKSLLISRESA